MSLALTYFVASELTKTSVRVVGAATIETIPADGFSS